MTKRVDLAKLRTIAVSAHATPTRRGANRVVDIDRRDAQLDKDVEAYKRLRKNGLQPPQIDGSAVRENYTERYMVEETPPPEQIEIAGNMGVPLEG